jgi:hypothetical protein
LRVAIAEQNEMRQDCAAASMVVLIKMAKMIDDSLHQIFDCFAAAPLGQHVVCGGKSPFGAAPSAAIACEMRQRESHSRRSDHSSSQRRCRILALVERIRLERALLINHSLRRVARIRI